MKLREFKEAIPGIYCIHTPVNGKRYIGSSVDIQHRMGQHLSLLRLGKHRNPHLQSAFSKYGEDAFLIQVVEQCERDQILSREQHYLDTLQPEYNVCRTAGNTLGYRHTAEGKAKMSEANKGNQRFLGRKHKDSTKALISQKATGRKYSDEKKAKARAQMMGNTHTLGFKHSEETKARMSAIQKHAWSSDEKKAVVASRSKALWADPEWKKAQAEKIAAGRAKAKAARALSQI